MKKGSFHLAWVLAAALSLAPSPAGADTAPSSAAQPWNPWTQSNLTGDWNGDRQKWIDRGLTITPIWTQEVFGNPTGGFRQGAVESGQLSLALDADASKFTGWAEAGQFHANFFYLYGPNLDTQDVGDFSAVSSNTGNNTFRMQECWYQQPFGTQRVSAKIGLITVDTDFFVSPTSTLFIDGTFGTPNLPALDDPYNFPTYPLAAPALEFNLKPTDNFSLLAGVFSGNNGSQTGNSNGFDFRLNGASGLLIMSEAAYLLNQGPNDQGLVGSYKVGFFVQTSPFQTWSSKTGNALSASPLDEQGPDYGIYGIIDQQVYKEDARIVSLFLRPGYAPSNINSINPYLDGGFDFTGFIPGRDKDVLGIAAARSWISGAYNHYDEAVNGASSATAETVMEATYRVQICPCWTLQPDLQYFLQPGGATTSHDALVLGCRSSIQF